MSSKLNHLTTLSLQFLMLWLLTYHSESFAVMAKHSTLEFLGFETYWDYRIEIEEEVITNGTAIKVLTYNIHHANPPSQPNTTIDVDAIASVINSVGPDLVAVEEVDVNTKRDGNINEAELLAKKTGMNHFFAKTINYDGGQYGILILSKFPILSTKEYHLPTKEGTGGEPRALATAEVLLPGNKTILFACTHLDAQKNNTNRVLQIAAILDILQNVSLPVIIGGDFNDTPGSVIIEQLDTQFMRSCEKLPAICGYTIPATLPTKTIDYIAFKPKTSFVVQNHAVVHGKVEKYASDHLPVQATLILQ